MGDLTNQSFFCKVYEVVHQLHGPVLESNLTDGEMILLIKKVSRSKILEIFKVYFIEDILFIINYEYPGNYNQYDTPKTFFGFHGNIDTMFLIYG